MPDAFEDALGRAEERADDALKRHPRFNVSDDATAVLIPVVP